MKKLTTKQFIKCFYTALFLLALFCPFFIDGEWHFWVTKLFTQGIEPAGKELALRCVLVLFLLLGKLFSGTGRRWEVRRAIRILGKDGGYIMTSAHHMQNDIPTENILAMYETELRYQ